MKNDTDSVEGHGRRLCLFAQRLPVRGFIGNLSAFDSRRSLAGRALQVSRTACWPPAECPTTPAARRTQFELRLWL
jgi:hypothetical protein